MTTSIEGTDTDGFVHYYNTYMDYCEQMGETIIQWADPNNEFRGYTNVRFYFVWLWNGSICDCTCALVGLGICMRSFRQVVLFFGGEMSFWKTRIVGIGSYVTCCCWLN
jgi:hypothetical protein